MGMWSLVYLAFNVDILNLEFGMKIKSLEC